MLISIGLKISQCDSYFQKGNLFVTFELRLISLCPFVLFILAIVLSVLLRYTDSDYPFGIFKLFLIMSLTYGLKKGSEKSEDTTGVIKSRN